MDNDQNWYRQLLALVLVSASRAAVEFITNPSSREDATKQLRGAFQEIDYDALAKSLTRSIDDLAQTSKGKLSDTIDTLRDKSVEAVDEAKAKAEKQVGKKSGRKMRFIIGLALGATIAYFILDEQRRDDLLDRLTGASGPIQQSTQSIYQQAANTAQEAANKAPDEVKESAKQAADATQKAADSTKGDKQK
jgi:hypothetical protein